MKDEIYREVAHLRGRMDQVVIDQTGFDAQNLPATIYNIAPLRTFDEDIFNYLIS